MLHCCSLFCCTIGHSWLGSRESPLTLFLVVNASLQNRGKSLLRLALPQHMHFVAKGTRDVPMWDIFQFHTQQTHLFQWVSSPQFIPLHHFRVVGVFLLLILCLHPFNCVSTHRGPSLGMWSSPSLLVSSTFSCNHLGVYSATSISHRNCTHRSKSFSFKSEACSVKSFANSSTSPIIDICFSMCLNTCPQCL